MGGSERSGPEHASASVVDGIVWVLTPDDEADPLAVAALEAWIERIGGRPVRMSPARHDRLVAFVSHLPQVASTALDGPGGDRGGRRARHPAARRGRVPRPDPSGVVEPGAVEPDPALEPRGRSPRRSICTRRGWRISARWSWRAGGATSSETFDGAKQARLRLAAKPQVRAGVAVLQVQAPDRPGALAELTSVLAEHDVNIEDLQIVHSPEGGRGTVHLTVAADVGRRRAPRAGVPVLRPDPPGLRSRRAHPRDPRRNRARGVPRSGRQVDRASLADPRRDRARTQPSGRGSGFPRRSLDRFLPRPWCPNAVDLHSRLGLATLRAGTEGHGSTWNEDASEEARTPLEVEGEGRSALTEAAGPLDCGNSGTSMRLLAGTLAAAPFRIGAHRRREPVRAADGAGGRAAPRDGRRRHHDRRPRAARDRRGDRCTASRYVCRSPPPR